MSQPCLPHRVQPPTLHAEQPPLGHEVHDRSGPGPRKSSWGLMAGLSLLWPDSGLGRGGTEPCQKLSLRAPVLRPSGPGSATVTCVGAGFMLLFQGLWQLLQLWGGSLLFPPTPAFKGSSSLTSQQLCSSLLWMSIVQYVDLPWQVGAFQRN